MLPDSYPSMHVAKNTYMPAMCLSIIERLPAILKREQAKARVAGSVVLMALLLGILVRRWRRESSPDATIPEHEKYVGDAANGQKEVRSPSKSYPSSYET